MNEFTNFLLKAQVSKKEKKDKFLKVCYVMRYFSRQGMNKIEVQ